MTAPPPPNQPGWPPGPPGPPQPPPYGPYAQGVGVYGQPQPPRPRTDGFAIASLVLGLIGGVLLAIIFGFVALSRIKRSGGMKTGRGLAIAGIVLGFAWIALIGVIVALAATGVFDDSNAKRFHGEKKAVAQTVDDFESAADDGDGAKLCRLFTPRYTAIIALGARKPCADAILDGSNGKRQAHLDIKSITIAGTRATSRLTEGGDPEVWTFERTDRWRIDNIARAGG